MMNPNKEQFIAQQRSFIFESHTKYQDKISDSLKEHSFFLDKAILAISTGAIALYFNISVNSDQIEGYTLMKVSVFFFVASIICVLLSFFMALIRLRMENNELKNQFDEKNELIDEFEKNTKHEAWIVLREKFLIKYDVPCKLKIFVFINNFLNITASLTALTGIILGAIVI